jgi:ribosome recycling factor
MQFEELQEIIDLANLNMEEAVEYCKKEFSHIRAGKASPSLLDTIKVEYYGALTPLQQLANVSAPEARLLVVQPYDKSVIPDIEKAIQSSSLGLNPNNDGEMIRIPFPMLTEERRKELVKLAKDVAEQCRVSIRNARRDANEQIKKTVADASLPENAKFDGEAEVQKLTDSFTSTVDSMLEAKEKDIMTV